MPVAEQSIFLPIPGQKSIKSDGFEIAVVGFEVDVVFVVKLDVVVVFFNSVVLAVLDAVVVVNDEVGILVVMVISLEVVTVKGVIVVGASI